MAVKTGNYFAATLAALAFVFVLPTAGEAAQTQPRLVLQITVDQLRGDLPEMVMDRVGPGGFRYLADQGVWYANAHHPHVKTHYLTANSHFYPKHSNLADPQTLGPMLMLRAISTIPGLPQI
jgi:hypothetical protein